MLSKEYKRPNPLNDVFLTRVRSVDCTDLIGLLRSYLGVFNPRVVNRAESFIEQYKGNEELLFTKLSQKFYAVNPFSLELGIISEKVDPKSKSSSCIVNSHQSPGIVA